MTAPVISFEKVSKAFSMYRGPKDIAREFLTGKPFPNQFWALRDVSFEVHEGQRLGIIGPNGSGKSTILKLISAHLQPTSGVIRVNGVVSAMLSLTTTLNQLETGISNIRFNLILNGTRPEDVPRLTDEIIDFTELGPFVDAPVSTYSTGMQSRLAFAISTAIRPDVLIVDEVLSVGDGYFVSKAVQRMRELCNQGRALVFVSHSTSAVQMLCDTVLWLDNGAVRAMGSTDRILKLYEEDYRRVEDAQTRSANKQREADAALRPSPSDITWGEQRLRLTSAGPSRILSDAHYVRSISMDVEGGRFVMDLVSGRACNADADFQLDLQHSEWGRVYTLDGQDCRLLAARTGRKRGGHIILSQKQLPPDTKARLTIVSMGTRKQESLVLERLDAEAGEWRTLTPVKSNVRDDGWSELHVDLAVESNTPEVVDATRRRLEVANQPALEIVSVNAVVAGSYVTMVRELEPFAIEVRVKAIRFVARADVGIKIIRNDGVYVFWQSSGDGAENIVDLQGEACVKFLFEPNLLSAGVYDISAYCANGWDYPSNYPYSEVFDRRVNACRLTVMQRLPDLDFGVINVRVPVSVEKE